MQNSRDLLTSSLLKSSLAARTECIFMRLVKRALLVGKRVVPLTLLILIIVAYADCNNESCQKEDLYRVQIQ
jgi:hypothetical protein